MNLNDLELEPLYDYKQLYHYITAQLCADKKNYIFIDEVQNCKQFEKVLDSLFINPNVDIYITGSNAYLLVRELAARLSGRYVTVNMLPLSFAEFTSASADKSKAEKFNQYLNRCFLSTAHGTYGWRSDARSYIEAIYQTILTKDIATCEGGGCWAISMCY